MISRIFIALFGILLVAGFFAYLYEGKDETNARPEENIGSMTLTGEYGCLPHVDNSGPQTAECAFGLQTDAGDYYALDLGFMSQTPPTLRDGDRITATGVFTPLAELSTDYWQKYPIEGIFSVTDSLEIEEALDPSSTGSSTQLSEADWKWVRTDYLSGETLAPDADDFVLSLSESGTMTSTTDCNSLSGDYVIDGEALSFGPFMSTLMYCEGSQEGEYSHDLSLVTSYSIMGNELRLNLNRDFGVMIFETRP